MPQGSNLAPLLFNIYINDLVNTLNELDIILFADDSCLYSSHQNLNILIDTINNELSIVQNWLNTNKLTLNLQKSHYLIFSRTEKQLQNQIIPPIQINNFNLERVNSTKFLGVILQSNLKWDIHIKNITSKINKYSSIIFRIRDNLDRGSLKLLYNSLIYPQLTYANIIWSHTYVTHLKSLFIAQKRVVRVIMYRNRRYHTNDDFKELSFIKLSD